MNSAAKVESLLAARLVLDPKAVGDRVYFPSDLTGRLSLHAMPVFGGRPTGPLIPADVSLQNPHLMVGSLYHVLPELGSILVMIDRDGDEKYRPMFVPLEGGPPVPVFADRYAGYRFYCSACMADRCLAVFTLTAPDDPLYQTILVDLRSLEVTLLSESSCGSVCMTATDDGSTLILLDTVTYGDDVVYLVRDGVRRVLFGTPLEERSTDHRGCVGGFRSAALADNGVLFVNTLTDDCFGLGYLALDRPQHVEPVEIVGACHTGAGELRTIDSIGRDRYRLAYNIDGCSWVYLGRYESAERRLVVTETLCGIGELREGVMQAIDFDRSSGRHVLSFSSAVSPSQLFVVGSEGTLRITDQELREITATQLSPGEDASFESHDALRISARLYLPAEDLEFERPHPLVFYIHGGPHRQERPDFTWFSMVLIQLLTLSGFAVFVPNARGSSGYGLSFAKRSDKDWGGLDRLDHVAAFETLQRDPRVDMSRVGVIGRSYGGYMTLSLASRHPDLWKAACSMFGPYDLLSFIERVPETWKRVFHRTIGHPEHDRADLIERSPSTHLNDLSCPLLVIQGANDPRILERESADLVRSLHEQGNTVEYLVFPDEGHDVIKHVSKVECYTRIADFFGRYL